MDSLKQWLARLRPSGASLVVPAPGSLEAPEERRGESTVPSGPSNGAALLIGQDSLDFGGENLIRLDHTGVSMARGFAFVGAAMENAEFRYLGPLDRDGGIEVLPCPGGGASVYLHVGGRKHAWGHQVSEERLRTFLEAAGEFLPALQDPAVQSLFWAAASKQGLQRYAKSASAAEFVRGAGALLQAQPESAPRMVLRVLSALELPEWSGREEELFPFLSSASVEIRLAGFRLLGQRLRTEAPKPETPAPRPRLR